MKDIQRILATRNNGLISAVGIRLICEMVLSQEHKGRRGKEFLAYLGTWDNPWKKETSVII